MCIVSTCKYSVSSYQYRKYQLNVVLVEHYYRHHQGNSIMCLDLLVSEIKAMLTTILLANQHMQFIN